MTTLNDLFIDYFLSEIFNDNLLSKDSFLDLGCGTQPYKKYYTNKFRKIVTADIEDRTKIGINVKLDPCCLPFKSNSFDIILFTEVIEHIPNTNNYLKEIERILKPRGLLLVTFPFNYSIHEIPKDYYRFTEFGMENILKENNLEILKILRRGNIFTLIHLLIAQLFLNIIEFINRIPVIGSIFNPINYLLKWFIQITYFFHLQILKHTKALNPKKTGEGLKGISGSLVLWTLGYCFLVRKKY